MDGVLTDTAATHARAWKQTFDAVLRDELGPDAAPFDADKDYARYVDGKPREDGVRDFLASRGIHPDEAGITRIGNEKNELVQQLIDTEGVKVYDGSVRFVRAVRDAGQATAVVSSSANTQRILHAAGIEDLFDVRVDGVVLATEHLRGKPAPDSFLRAASQLGVEPANGAVFEDAIAGVAAGHAGGFLLTVGVDRLDQADALRENGADIVVKDLAELLS